MTELVKLQSEWRSNISLNRLCTFNMEVINKPTEPLIHQEARFWLINKGDATARIHGRTVHLKPGSLVAVLPWEITEIQEVRVPLQYYIVVYHFDSISMLIKSLCGSLSDSPELFEEIKKNPEIKCQKRQYQMIKEIFLDLREEVGTKDTLQTGTPKKLSNAYVINKLVSLILEFFRMQGSFEDEKQEFNKEEILQYIYTHLSEDISARSLSKIFYLSENTVSHYIRQLTGLSVGQLCHEMRLVRVSNYLLYTDLTVSELSEIVGYSDASHLSKLFKARMGTNINDYRKTYRKISKICDVEESKKVYSLISYIYRNHTEDLSIKQLSERFDMSAMNINKALISQVEKTFSEFLNYIRINHACKLLLTTDKTILDIAVEVGYNNAKTFTRNFVKDKVMMPSEFKKRVWLQDEALGENMLSECEK